MKSSCIMSWLIAVVVLVGSTWVVGTVEYSNVRTTTTHIDDFLDGYRNEYVAANGGEVLKVELTLVQGADAKGAVCLDGSLPGYHFHGGSGSGANSWLIDLEGGGWCNDVESCVERKTTRRGSTHYMDKYTNFTGMLSNKPDDNPDFYNWNRVKIRYCDGASFNGEGYDETNKLYFRGLRIWSAVMEELMKSKGLQNADQALLSGTSAGGLASILHCDQFQALFPNSSGTKIKCLSDAGLFLDIADVSGGHTIRDFYKGVVTLQDVEKNLPSSCTDHLDSTSCFFPENLIANVKTPLFILNSAYDTWQVHQSLAPGTADPHNKWHDCKRNNSKCSPSQLQILQGFRNQMINAVQDFMGSAQNGLFINSCFAHGQAETQDTWFANDSPIIQDKKIATAVGDWFFDRLPPVQLIDCPYPCDKTCHDVVY